MYFYQALMLFLNFHARPRDFPAAPLKEPRGELLRFFPFIPSALHSFALFSSRYIHLVLAIIHIYARAYVRICVVEIKIFGTPSLSFPDKKQELSGRKGKRRAGVYSRRGEILPLRPLFSLSLSFHRVKTPGN